MKAENLDQAKDIYFIGIGGIGLSAVARLMIEKGKHVSGSDRSGSEVTELLEKAGVKINLTQTAENIPSSADLVVYTVAVPADNPEMSEAKRRNLKTMSYPEALSEITRGKTTIAVAGTHGKTTTTAMIAKILMDAKKEPTVIVGSLIKSLKSNFVFGKSDFLVVEADEYKRSFHSLYPKILVINNIDEDHLDCYKDLADIQESFNILARRVPKDGLIICKKDDPHIIPAIRGVSARIIDSTPFVGQAKLGIPGRHNALNASSAFATAQALGIDSNLIKDSLGAFENTWRRFELVGRTAEGAYVYDDYAHNPQKVSSAISGAREAHPKARIVVVFQPHLFSRTKLLMKEFSTAFEEAQEMILLPIYPAREVDDGSVSSEDLCHAIVGTGKKTILAKDFSESAKLAGELAHKDDVIMCIGAGNVDEVSKILIGKTRG